MLKLQFLKSLVLSSIKVTNDGLEGIQKAVLKHMLAGSEKSNKIDYL
jgi:hypothetical protein